jgi:D-alanyl-lipoteichoic acid acyltransferase DltB (MBOAT superfamily)
MARGTARLFGVNLTENFDSPYQATSIVNFWRRWHISFSRWILDYIFKPLQMTWRYWGQTGTALALLVTFLISGLWHGLSIGFIIWGLLHGVYLAASTYYRPYQKKIYKALGVHNSRWLAWWQMTVTFNLVCFAWIFFRAASLRDALYLVRNIPTSMTTEVTKLARDDFFSSQILLGNNYVNTAFLVLFIVAAVVVNRLRSRHTILTQPVWIRWPLYFILSLVIILFDTGNKAFVYFQF